MKFTKTWEKQIDAVNTRKRFVICQGGTRSGKTLANLQILWLIATHKPNTVISVVSESLPHLKRGAIRDFESLLKSINRYDERYINFTDNIYHFGSSFIEFFSVDNSSKVRGPARDYLFCNEVNAIPKATFDELVVRTREQIIVDFNPVAEFYVHTDIMTRPASDYEFVRTTYKDNDLLHPNIVAEIESRKGNSNWWRVYGLGEIGTLEGLIFPSWTMCEDMPVTDKRRIGLDFGYTNDPTAIIDVRLNNGELYLDELEYRSGMSNADIAAVLKRQAAVKVIADSSEPKSIDDLSRMGLKVAGAVKGAGSVNLGIEKMQSFKINVTKRSVNLHKELRNYQWAKSRDGKMLNEPIDIFNHAIDAARYAVSDLTMQKEIRPPRTTFTIGNGGY